MTTNELLGLKVFIAPTPGQCFLHAQAIHNALFGRPAASGQVHLCRSCFDSLRTKLDEQAGPQ